MFKAQQFKLSTVHRTQHGVIRDVRTFQYALNQIFRQDHRLPFNLHQRIIEISREGNGAVSRQRPRCGGPDNQRNRAVDGRDTEFGFHRFRIDGVESHVDRRRGFVVILHFRFCQCRTAVNTPVHRLRAFVQVAITDDFTQRTNNVGFSFEVHGQVWT
ncbi:hypothetical protein D3C80_561540 [compost metagenome]